MMESLKICEDYGFEKPTDLKDKLNEVGTNLSVTRKQITYFGVCIQCSAL